jgi:Icc-related predicted phosphoesterase
MKILVLSDLHLEWQEFMLVHNDRRIDDGVDVVVLAGDIAEGVDGIRWARESFLSKEIVYVPGNHEFYKHNIDAPSEHMKEVAQRMGVHLLQRDCVAIGGVRFLGSTMWTDFEIFGVDYRDKCMHEAGMALEDYWRIKTSQGFKPNARRLLGGIRQRLFTPADSLREHQLNTAWLSAELATGDPDKTVVVTHHAPHWNSVELKYAADLLTAAYVSDLTRLMGRSRYWIHGHMHSQSDYLVNGTRVVANPRGRIYRDWSQENPAFNPALVLEI